MGCVQLHPWHVHLTDYLTIAALSTLGLDLLQAVHGFDIHVTFSGQAARRRLFGLRAPPGHLGLGVRQAAAFDSNYAEHALGELLQDMEGANLMCHVAKDRADRSSWWHTRVLIILIGYVRFPFESQVALRQCRLQPSQKGSDVRMSGLVIEHGIENPLVLSIVDDRQYTVWPLIELVCRHRARKRRQRPVQKRAVHLPVRLFFPRPLPSSVACRIAQTPGGHATGASWCGDTACRLPPLSAPPTGSPDGGNDSRARLNRTDRC